MPERFVRNPKLRHDKILHRRMNHPSRIPKTNKVRDIVYIEIKKTTLMNINAIDAIYHNITQIYILKEVCRTEYISTE